MTNLVRTNKTNAVFAGVCGGLANSLGLSVTGLRILTVITTLFLTGIPIFVYLALWLLMKKEQ